ncbi:hypothetical protein DH2020_032852 [Rehmannia glutinosa]|uniref:Uncharacterized protein n=1 Tax=Rehmannia glutinosa TaxID=99300 RepID=A0ABR0VDX1_REHGL
MSGGGGGVAQQSAHSLAFRVMRLCRPSLHVNTSPLKFDPCDLLFGEDLFDDPIAASHLPRLLSSQSNPSAVDPSDPSYRSRFLLQHPTDSLGLPGLLVLPQSFGYMHIHTCSIFNNALDNVLVEAEIQTERQRILLLDTSKSPVESIRASGRYDFIVEHDVKELGAHTLVCTALYTDGDSERKYLPQFFKFVVSNPISVRTKVRNVKDITLLEACIENHTKSNLYMDQVEFEPAQHWSATVLKAADHSSEHNLLTRETFKEPILIRSGEEFITIFTLLLFLLLRIPLQPITRKEIELHAVEIPPVIILEKSFLVSLNLINLTERVLGPFEVWLSESDSLDERAVMINGLQTTTLGEVQAFSSLKLQLNLIAIKHGIQKITGITVFDTIEKKTYDSLLEMEIYVDSE